MTLLPLRPLRKRAQRAPELAAGRTVRDLFEQHGQMVYAVCRLNLRDRLDAEDATQQTFLAAYRSLLGGGEPDDPPAWLAVIARNECSRLRKKRPATVPIDDSEGASRDLASVVGQREEIELLATALSDLPPAQRNAVVLREFYGLSYAEVSSVLGVSGPAVESLLFKGRRHLQEKLGSLRAASAIMLPDTVRDALVHVLPRFGGGAAAGASGIAALPAATKIAAVAAIVAGGGVTVTDTVYRDPSRPVEIAIGAPREQHPAAPRVSRPPVAPARGSAAPSVRRREAAPVMDERTVQNSARGTADLDDDPRGAGSGAEPAMEREGDERDGGRETAAENDELAGADDVVSTAREQERDDDEPDDDIGDAGDELTADDTADSDADDTLDD